MSFAGAPGRAHLQTTHKKQKSTAANTYVWRCTPVSLEEKEWLEGDYTTEPLQRSSEVSPVALLRAAVNPHWPGLRLDCALISTTMRSFADHRATSNVPAPLLYSAIEFSASVL